MANPGRLTDYCTSGGCAAKLPAGALDAILSLIPRGPTDPNLLVGTETHDDATWRVFYVVAPDGLCYWFGERENA